MANKIITLLYFTAVVAAITAKSAPVAVFHGLGDSCIFPGMSQLTQEIAKGIDGVAACIQIGNGTLTSWLENFETQAESACNSLKSDSRFNSVDQISVVGLSHGSLIARFIIEQCDLQAKVRNYVSIGGPHQGVAALPQCSSGIICNFINGITDKAIYFSFIQNHVGPAGYFKDPQNFNEYAKYCSFLPKLNNQQESEKLEKQLARKARFSDLNKMMLMMFTEDTVVYPKESEWFWEFDSNYNLIKVEDTDLYKNDTVGLKTLMESGKVEFVSVKGNHLQFSDDDLKNKIIPALAA